MINPLVDVSRKHVIGAAVAAISAVDLLLIAIGVIVFPESLKGGGAAPFAIDVIALLACASVGGWVWLQRDWRVRRALDAAAPFGFALAAIFALHHVVEFFGPSFKGPALLILGAGPVILMIGLFATVGSLGRERTQSLLMGVVAGIWCAIVAMVTFLLFAFAVNAMFAPHLEAGLREPFAASGMRDPAAYLVRNSFDAASELLTRMPMAALIVSFIGGTANAALAGRPAFVNYAVVAVAPAMLTVAVFLLLRADALERTARPPLVMSGLALACVALSCAHAAWSGLKRSKR
jgi:hypothetical protein